MTQVETATGPIEGSALGTVLMLAANARSGHAAQVSPAAKAQAAGSQSWCERCDEGVEREGQR